MNDDAEDYLIDGRLSTERHVSFDIKHFGQIRVVMRQNIEE